MKHIGWLINGVFYPLSSGDVVERYKSNCIRNVQILPVYAEEDVCVKY